MSLMFFPMVSVIRTDSVFDARCAAAAVRDAYHRQTGQWCTLPEALAAAFSVPDGTPADMAAINVGVAMNEECVRQFERARDGLRRLR